MEGLNLFHQPSWRPLKLFGLTHSFFDINSEVIISTWAAMGIILILSLIGRYLLTKPKSLGGYIVNKILKSFIGLVEQSYGKFHYRYFAFITSMFTFIIMCNWVGLIPILEEPTKDLNTTLALGIIAFLYTQKESIYKNGFVEYIKEYFSPIFLMFPLNVLGEIASIISLSFRLFGNIFGGSVIIAIFNSAITGSWIANSLVTVTGVNLVILIFFIIFEGFLQAFVFSILTLTNLAMAVQDKSGEHVV